jgi:hypothetical protein
VGVPAGSGACAVIALCALRPVHARYSFGARAGCAALTPLTPAQHNGTLDELDRRMAAFPTRHGNADVPYRHFCSGISTIPSLPANEVVPLFIMLSVCVGDGPGVFPAARERTGVQKICKAFLDMCRTAHLEVLTLGGLADLENSSRELLQVCVRLCPRVFFVCVVPCARPAPA